MTDLENQLRRYAANRAASVTDRDAELIVAKTTKTPRPSPWRRQGLNAAAAVGLSLVLLVGGVVLGMQSRFMHQAASTPSAGPLPAVPNDIVYFDSLAQDPTLVTPYRLRDRHVLTPQTRVILAPGTGLSISSGCDVSVVHVVDLGSPPHDLRPPVSLTGCYNSPVVVPNSTLVLLAHQASTGGSNVTDLGSVAFDWSTGRVVKSYPDASLVSGGGLVSRDGKVLYSMNAFVDNPTLDMIDLGSGTRIAHIPVQVFGQNGGGMALSPDGHTLYVNEGIWLRTFDAHTGKAGPVLDFKGPKAGPVAQLPGWLQSWLPSSIDAAAKEGIEPGHGVAVDPNGQWVAALGINQPSYQGLWLFDTSGSIRLARHIDVTIDSAGGGFRGVAFSADGSVCYALRVQARAAILDIIDPQTGRQRSIMDLHLAGMDDISGAIPAP
jgi:hypothetical protein